MKTTNVLFTFKGRIARRQYWMQSVLQKTSASWLTRFTFFGLEPISETQGNHRYSGTRTNRAKSKPHSGAQSQANTKLENKA